MNAAYRDPERVQRLARSKGESALADSKGRATGKKGFESEIPLILYAWNIPKRWGIRGD